MLSQLWINAVTAMVWLLCAAEVWVIYRMLRKHNDSTNRPAATDSLTEAPNAQSELVTKTVSVSRSASDETLAQTPYPRPRPGKTNGGNGIRGGLRRGVTIFTGREKRWRDIKAK